MLLAYLDLQQPSKIFIEGMVVCNSGKPLGGAKLFFVPRLEEAVSSDTGHFTLGTTMTLPLLLIVSHDHYESCRLTIYDVAARYVIRLSGK